MENRITRIGVRAGLGMLLAGALVISSGMMAGAAEPSDIDSSGAIGATSSSAEPIASQQLIEAKAEMDNTGWPQTEYRDEAGGTVTSNYTLPSGQSFGVVVPDDQSKLSDSIAQISFGADKAGSYIDFSHDDQAALLRSGVAGVVGLLCLAGKVVCKIATVIAAGASFFLDARGICPGDQVARIYYTHDGTITSATCIRG